MSDLRLFQNDDDEVVRGLRSLYAAPAGDAYWDGLQSRIMARVSDVELEWWTELDRWIRPAMVAAAVLLLAASAAMLYARKSETDIAVDSMLSAPVAPVPAAIRPAMQDERDARTRYLLGCNPQETSCSAQSSKR